MHTGIAFCTKGRVPRVVFILSLLCTGMTSGNIVITPKVPEVNKTATISCYVPAPRYWHLLAGTVICFDVVCDPDAYGSYTFRADPSKTDLIFQSLNRSRDERVWTCQHGSTNYSVNLQIYTIPRGLDLIQIPDMNVDLGMTSITIQCRTTSCTYPEPSVEWLYKDQPTSSSYEMYTRSTPSSTQGPCVLPEKIYTGSISVSQNTAWSDNSDKTVTFFCRIGYSDPSKNITSLASKPVSFAVRVTEAFLQYNNQNISSTLMVTSGELVTLTCVTGTSRPAPNIDWYIGSQSMGSGTSLIFSPRNTDHNQVIYCQAYNIDPNLKVDSNKPSLFVRGAPKILEIYPSYKGYVGEYTMIKFNLYSNTDENLTITARHSNYSGLIHQGIILPIRPDDLQFYSSQIPAPDFRATLAIIIKSTNDFGLYHVEVKNIVGSDSKIIQIIEQIIPEKPLNFHARNVQEKQLLLRWQSGYHGGFTQTFVIEISLDNITWNNVSEVNAGNRDGWFSTIIEDLVPGSEYYLRLYAYNIYGRGDFADVQLAIRMLKEPAYTSSLEVCTSVGIGVGGAVGIGVGGIVLGLIGTIITFTIRKKLNVKEIQMKNCIPTQIRR